MNVPIWLVAQAQTGQGTQGILSYIPLFLMLGLIFYFIVLRPEQKNAEKKEQLLQSLKKGDEVILASGLHGKIHEVQEKVMVIEIADKVRVKVERNAIKGLAYPPPTAS